MLSRDIFLNNRAPVRDVVRNPFRMGFSSEFTGRRLFNTMCVGGSCMVGLHLRGTIDLEFLCIVSNGSQCFTVLFLESLGDLFW